MMHQFLRSSYKTHKEDTEYVTTWLVQTAKKYGYPTDLLPGVRAGVGGTASDAQAPEKSRGRLKGKARTEAKAQRTAVEKAPVQKLETFEQPQTKQKPAYPTQAGSGQQGPDRHASDHSHAHFLGVLKHTITISAPLIPRPADSPPAQYTRLENGFSRLVVEEPSDSFQRLAFSPISLLRGLVKSAWEARLNGRDIRAVAIVINTAITFLRDLEEAFQTQFLENLGYVKKAELVHYIQCRMRNHDTDWTQDAEAYELAEEIMLTTNHVLTALQNQVEPGTSSIFKPDQFGRQDKSIPWYAKSHQEKFNDDELVLLEAFPDMQILTDVPALTGKHLLCEVELIRGVRTMKPGAVIPVLLVFALQYFLDAHHILGNHFDRSYNQSKHTSQSIRDSVVELKDFHTSATMTAWPNQGDQLDEMLQIIENWVDSDVIGDVILIVYFSLLPHVMSPKLTDMQMPDAKDMAPPEPYRLLKQYPLICGLWLFAVRYHAQEIGIKFVNTLGSMLCTAHFYNAVIQSDSLFTHWQDMELLLSLQGFNILFVGGPPSGVEKYYPISKLSLGDNPTNYARNRRRPPPDKTMSKQGPRGLSKLGAISRLCAGRYCENKEAVPWSKVSIKSKLDSRFVYDDEVAEETTAGGATVFVEAGSKPTTFKKAIPGIPIRKPRIAEAVVPLQDFFNDFLNILDTEVTEMSVDYLLMHPVCWGLLRRVNESCKPELRSIFGVGYIPKEIHLSLSLVAHIFETLECEGAETTVRLLHTAAVATNEMLAKGTGRAVMM
ncbi:MAG: hypothetical protein Q9218_003100 [Villophora microphyllina]